MPVVSSLLKVSLSSLLLFMPLMSVQAASFEGEESVLLIHPLCIDPLMAQEDDGGAFDMAACAELMADTPVKRTPDGSLYAKRDMQNDVNASGYVVYKPIGTLDKGLELILYHDKQLDNPVHSRVLVMARLPHLSVSHREFITSIEEPGIRCNGGIQTARLISEAILEVDLNVNPATLMKLAAPELRLGQANKSNGDIATLSLKPRDHLDGEESHCIGTVTKTYNLLDSQEAPERVAIFSGLRAEADNAYQQCFDELLADFITPPATLTLPEFGLFKQLFVSTCGIK